MLLLKSDKWTRKLPCVQRFLGSLLGEPAGLFTLRYVSVRWMFLSSLFLSWNVWVCAESPAIPTELTASSPVLNLRASAAGTRKTIKNENLIINLGLILVEIFLIYYLNNRKQQCWECRSAFQGCSAWCSGSSGWWPMMGSEWGSLECFRDTTRSPGLL